MIEALLSGISAKALKRSQKLAMDISSEKAHREINDLLQRTVLVGGKRLRPLLTYLAADFFGLRAEQVDVAARSIEMVHAASLSHDDVIDQATMRRGNESINAISSNKKAVLAGDYLLANVIVELSSLGNLALVREMSLVIEALSEGEWIQLEAAEERAYSEEIIKKIALYKTSSVMSWCMVAPAIISNLPDSIISLAKSFGEHLGLAFQLLDDTFDLNEESEKDKGLDLKNGIVNSVYYKWFLAHPKAYERFKKGEDIEEILDFSSMNEAALEVQKEALEHLDHCRALLDQMEEKLVLTHNQDGLAKSKKSLLNILSYLEKRKS